MYLPGTKLKLIDSDETGVVVDLDNLPEKPHTVSVEEMKRIADEERCYFVLHSYKRKGFTFSPYWLILSKDNSWQPIEIEDATSLTPAQLYSANQNSSATHCIQCGEKLYIPYPNIKYCRKCEK